MPINTLRAFLDEHNVKYMVISHSRAYTAQEVAASAHIPGREIAKTVIVKLDGKMAMAVLPAPQMVDLERLAAQSGAQQAVLASVHPVLLFNLESLAALCRRQGRYEEAAGVFERVLELQETELGPDDAAVGYTLNSLAIVFFNQGEYEEADALFRRSLAIKE